jgi:hypothetical protein
MNIRYKEDPGVWRKNTWLSLLPLFVLSSILRWRHVLSGKAWAIIVFILLVLVIAAWLQPRWFRGYYRFSMWAGFWSSHWLARLFLMLVFALVIFPAALILRLLGKDPLHLKRVSGTTSYWRPAKQPGSLDRLF